MVSAERTPSRTALATACIRAVHQLFDAPPRILDDPVAPVLIGPAARAQIRDPSTRLRSPDAAALRAHVVLRSRYAEDRLSAAVARGVTQYVLLGAGFDTFALRQPGWARALRIVEVDQAATQDRKRSMLAAAGLVVPDNLRFADVDFEREPLRDGLSRAGISLDEPTFFSWLGVTMYLSRDAVLATLRSVAGFPAGSEIVLTFAQPPERVSGEARIALSALERRVAAAGEPFVCHFTPDELAAALRDAGFSAIDFLSPAETEARYFGGRPRDLPVPGRTAIAAAIR